MSETGVIYIQPVSAVHSQALKQHGTYSRDIDFMVDPYHVYTFKQHKKCVGSNV